VGIFLYFLEKALASEPIAFCLHRWQHLYGFQYLVALSVSPGHFPLGTEWKKAVLPS
jgi:hypothetical protein